MRGLSIAIAATALAAAGVAAAQDVVIPPPVTVAPLPEGTKTRPVQLARLVVKIGRGDPFGRFKVGLFCIGGGTLR